MGEESAVPLGRRIATLRKAKGMTQQDFAEALKRSPSWVSQVERGTRLVDRQSVLQKMAVVLGVPSQTFLTSDDEHHGTWIAPARGSVEILRSALAGHPVPEQALGSAGSIPSGKADLSFLVEESSRAWTLVHDAGYEEAAPLLATLIDGLEHTTRQTGVSDPSAFSALASTYQAAAALLVKLDDVGAAWVAADRAITAGERCGDRLLVLAGQYRMAHLFVHARELPLARHVLSRALQALVPDAAATDVGFCSLAGACALLLAVLSARDNDARSAERHLKMATGLARRVGPGRNEFDTEFGPANVLMHRVAVDVELGNAGQALLDAKHVDLRGLSPERQARYLVDVARAHAMRRSLREAVACLERAEALAPGEIANLAVVHELLVDLVNLAGRSQVSGLRHLAERLGAAQN